MTRGTGEDKQQIGLTPAGQAALTRLVEAGLFDAEADAYRSTIAYSLGRGISLDDAPSGGYVTKYNARGTLDIDGMIRDLLFVLEVGEAGRPYATAERLAELGMLDLDRRVTAHESLAEIMGELLEIPRAG